MSDLWRILLARWTGDFSRAAGGGALLAMYSPVRSLLAFRWSSALSQTLNLSLVSGAHTLLVGLDDDIMQDLQRRDR